MTYLHARAGSNAKSGAFRLFAAHLPGYPSSFFLQAGSLPTCHALGPNCTGEDGAFSVRPFPIVRRLPASIFRRNQARLPIRSAFTTAITRTTVRGARSSLLPRSEMPCG